MAHAEARRRRGALPDAVVADLDDLCLQAADDALVSITAKLDDFAGRSRFTTWAIKFAIFEISTRLRRHAWRGRSVQLDDESWSRLPDARATTGQQRAEHRELIGKLRRAVDQVLTPRQRDVFIAAAVQEVPIDVLAERLGSNRGAVYKTLHDARKLRGALADAGATITSGTADQLRDLDGTPIIRRHATTLAAALAVPADIRRRSRAHSAAPPFWWLS